MIDLLCRLNILNGERMKELGIGPHRMPHDYARFLKELKSRGWVSAYQAEMLLGGAAGDLRVGPYVIEEPINKGAMGQVYKARHIQLDRVAAIKLIAANRLGNPDAIARFQREARAAARLLHPNVVVVFDAGENRGQHFYAMEYIPGIDLKELVQQHGALSAKRACFYIRQAALGLQHAFDQGLVHRDIKPGNLILTPWPQQHGNPGTVKILDFGLARLTSQVFSGDQLTTTGQIMGTPDFMAPEQVKNSSSVDIRADIYSLGGTLYCLLTGQVPFPTKSMRDKIFGRLSRDPQPLTELCRGVSENLAAVVARMMSRDRDKRFSAPLEVADALAVFTGEPLSSTSITLPPLMKSPVDGGSTTDYVPSTLGSTKGFAPTFARRSGRRSALIAAGVAIAGTFASAVAWFAWKRTRKE